MPHLEQGFRSRGTSIIKDTPPQIREKSYWDNTCPGIADPWLNGLEQSKVISCFEEARSKTVIDAYNYHVNLSGNYAGILDKATQPTLRSISTLRKCMGPNYLPYTLGIRMGTGGISTISYYYYPTAWKGNRIGIMGEIDAPSYTARVREFLDESGFESGPEFDSFMSTTWKFKGLSLTDHQGQTLVKLYAKVMQDTFIAHLKNCFPEAQNKIRESTRGEIVLACARFASGKIEGYNYYFLTQK